VGTSVTLITAAMLSVIADALDDRSLWQLIMGIIVFLIVWGISLTTNTHNFYLKSSLEDIQQRELNEVKTELELLKTNSEAVKASILAECGSNIGQKIAKYQGEVENPTNPGHGPEALKYLHEVEASMPPSTFGGSCLNCTTNLAEAKKFSQHMGNLMKAELDTRLGTLDQLINVTSCIDSQRYDGVIIDLDNTISSFHNSNSQLIRSTLNKAFSLYYQSIDCINTKLVSGFLICYDPGKKLQLKLPRTPGSIDLEHIANTWKYVRENKEFGTSRFLFALLIALGVDLGAFVIFYFMVLKRNSNF
jgi:hypothetical protein